MKQGEKTKLVDLNSILKWLNGIFCLLFILSYLNIGPTKYVNIYTIIIGVFLSFQISFFLFIEKRRRDPFLILLCFQMVAFFILRILTLSLDFHSVVFDRFPFDVNNLNYALVFIICANFSLFAGLSLNNKKLSKINPIDEIKSEPYKTYTVVIVLFIGYMLGLAGILDLVVIGAVFNILSGLFIKLSVILFMILVYLFVFKNKLSKVTFVILLFGFILFILIQTLTGSRSAILTIINFCIFSLLAIHSCIKIKKWTIVGLIILVPLMVSFFLFATFLRPKLQENRAVIGKDTFEVLGEFNIIETIKEDAHFLLSPIFDRVGFLDYTAETMANSEKYKSILSVQYFFKSITDNVLSPGFDVFDVPLESNAMRFIYLPEFGTPLKSKITPESYQSDEFTFYGEFYVMFGKWFSLIPIFFIGFMIKRVYLKITDKYEYFAIFKRGIVIAIFYTLLNSFGLDWLLLDLLGFIFTYKIFKLFFKFREPILSLN